MNIKKIGLTALAGSLVATSAYAGELSLSGSATITYSDYSGTHATSVTKAAAESNWGMDQDITASGSGELDNGWVVSLSHSLGASGATSTTSSITVDMGDAGTLVYSDASVGGGLNALDDITPTAWEEATDGPEGDVQAGMGNGAGFSYALPEIAGATVSIQYSDNFTTDGVTNDGAVSTSAADNGASHSIGIQYPVGDSVTIYGGIGTESQVDGNDIDHSTVGVKATFGAVSVGIQRNDEDDTAASSPVDLETTIIGVSFMVNENLSISYGTHNTSKDGAVDQDIDSIQAAYSMGGVSVKAQNSKAENVANAAGTSEKTEISVSFAF
jgi:outer membrane protein OmpU